MSWLSEVKRIASELSMRHKYINDERGPLEKYYNKLNFWYPESKIGKNSRTAGMKTIDTTWFLFCLMKQITRYTVDNFDFNRDVVEKVKSKKQQIKDFNKFFDDLKKSHPVAVARLHKWMLYALFIGMFAGGIKLAYDKNNTESTPEEMVTDLTKSKKDKIYNVKDDDFTKKFVDDNWDKIVICLLEFETYNETPKLHEGEKRYTYGPGLTWVYIDGEQYPCSGKYKDIVSKFSDEQIWEQVRQHCLYKRSFLTKIKKSLIKHNVSEISSEQMLSLFLVAYQLPNTIDGVVSKIKKAGDDKQKTIDAFMAGSEVSEQYRAGTNKRRWWCAMLYTGDITVSDLLKMDRDAFVHIKLDSIKQNNHFVYNGELIQYALDSKNTNNDTVHDFILSRSILDSEDVDVYVKNDSSVVKAISFNQGIKNIKNKPKNNTVVYPLDKEYRA